MNELTEDISRCAIAGNDAGKEYIPPKMEILRENSIEIRFLSIGCTIRVGCREIAFQNIETAMEELNKYIKNPHQERKKWNEKFIKEDNNG